jgi:hypothetical protein
MTTFDERACLQVNPFDGDFGSPGDRVLKDKIGTARKGGMCGMCRQEIQPGERVRLLAAIFDGRMMSYRWCSACCAAMAVSWHDEGRTLEARVRLGDESSKDKPSRAAPGTE